MELDMELYEKPVMTIAEIEKLDVLTGSDESEIPDVGDDGDVVVRPRP